MTKYPTTIRELDQYKFVKPYPLVEIVTLILVISLGFCYTFEKLNEFNVKAPIALGVSK